MARFVQRCASMLVLVCLVAYAQEQPITPQDIQANWLGKTLVGTTATGAPATMKLDKDGTATLTAGKTNDTGNWRLSDAGYCTTWKTVRAGQERCFTARRAGEKITVLNPDGSVSGHFNEIR